MQKNRLDPDHLKELRCGKFENTVLYTTHTITFTNQTINNFLQKEMIIYVSLFTLCASYVRIILSHCDYPIIIVYAQYLCFVTI